MTMNNNHLLTPKEREDYRAFIDTLGSNQRIPTAQEWLASVQTPPTVAERQVPQWPIIAPVREVVKKRPITSILASVLGTLLSAEVINPGLGEKVAGVLGLLKLFGL